MTIYEPVPVEEAELCQPVDDADFDVLSKFLSGSGDGSPWSPVHVRIEREDDGRTLEYSDAPTSGSSDILILRRKAAKLLEPILLQFGELLPLACAEADVVAFSPKYVLADALDEERSSIIRFDDGRIMEIERAVFSERAISGIDIFKIANVPNSDYYVSERFVSAWKAAGLVGLDFEAIWPNPKS